MVSIWNWDFRCVKKDTRTENYNEGNDRKREGRGNRSKIRRVLKKKWE